MILPAKFKDMWWLPWKFKDVDDTIYQVYGLIYITLEV